MSLQEVYCSSDGSLYMIERISKNRMFFRYRLLSKEEIKEFIDSICVIKEKANSLGGETSEPADKTNGWMTQQHSSSSKEVVVS